jgi:hypothetical protein
MNRNLPLAICSILLCVLAALAKLTTWPAFVIGYGIFLAGELYRTRKLQIQSVLYCGSGILLALAVTVTWTFHTDQIRLLNQFGGSLTSTALRDHIYGTWYQLFSEELWFEILPRRILPDALGYCWPVLLICIRYVRIRSQRTVAAVASLVLFILPIAIFTNLHIVHDYYQTANAIFLVAAAALLLSELIAVQKPILAAVIATFLVIGALGRFFSHQWVLARPVTTHPFYIAAKLVANSTPPASSLIVFGADSSSEVHYYAQRKGVALPFWAPDQARKFLDHPDAIMGG